MLGFSAESSPGRSLRDNIRMLLEADAGHWFSTTTDNYFIELLIDPSYQESVQILLTPINREFEPEIQSLTLSVSPTTIYCTQLLLDGSTDHFSLDMTHNSIIRYAHEETADYDITEPIILHQLDKKRYIYCYKDRSDTSQCNYS